MTKSLVFEWRRRRRFDLRRPFVGIFLHKNCVVIGWRLACVGRRFVVVLFGTVLYRPRTILLFWQLRLKQVSFWNCFVSRLLSWRLQSTCWIWAWNFWRRLHPCRPRAVFPPNFIANWLSVPFFSITDASSMLFPSLDAFPNAALVACSASSSSSSRSH